MKAKTVRKFLILYSICIGISLIISVYGYLNNNLEITFYSLIICTWLLSCSIDTINNIIKVSSGLTTWEHLRKLINRDERNL